MAGAVMLAVAVVTPELVITFPVATSEPLMRKLTVPVGAVAPLPLPGGVMVAVRVTLLPTPGVVEDRPRETVGVLAPTLIVAGREVVVL